MQNCFPSFFDSREAIIQADEVLTGGENFCTLWGAFAERGLGIDAKVVGRTPWGGGVRTDVRYIFSPFVQEYTLLTSLKGLRCTPAM